MCNFFSVISDGKGNVKHFTPEDIVSIMVKGNPESYDFNSHTSLTHFLGISAKNEEKYNKWEYSPETKELKKDEIVGLDDGKEVQKYLDDWFKGKDVVWLRNLYGRNSGHWNSGNMNSGDWNSGNRNSGDMNSGNRNSGDMNSGDMNSGNMNSGNRNSGDRNSGDWNSGNMNSGHWNSGNRNSGDWNSGDWNSGKGVLNSFCTERQYLIFNKPCTKEEYEEINRLPWEWFVLNEWIDKSDMTKAEKETFPFYETTGGYLKTISYKEAWSKCPKSFLKQVKKLKNYDPVLFEEITGIKNT